MTPSRDTPFAQHLNTSEARYRTLVENPNLGVFLMDPQGRYLFANAKIQEMTGYTPAEFKRNSRIGFTITHPDDHGVGMRAFRNALLGRPSQHNEFRLLHRNGETRWTAAACYPVLGQQDRVTAIQVVIQDITDRRLAQQELAREAQLREAEAAIRLRIAHMQVNHDLIEVVGEISDQIRRLGIEHDACSIQIVNDDATDFICCSRFHPRDVLVRKLDHLRSLAWTPTTDNMQIHPWVGQVWRTKVSRYEPYMPEISKMMPGISLIDVPFSHGTLAINRQSPHAFDETCVQTLERLAVVLSEGFQRFIDLLRREQLEEQLRESQKMEALGQLVAGVSHNFNNMLMVILGNLGIARQELPASEHLDAALEASKRTAEIIDELMLYSRRSSATKEPTDVQQVVSQAIAFCRRTFDDRISLRLTIQGDLPSVMGHAGRLQQVAVNFCINARDAIEVANPRAPVIDVRLDTVDAPRLPESVDAGNSSRYLRLQIQDNGHGIDDETRQRIFEPFYTTKDPGKGTGLGLSTAYAIIHDHDGWIDVEGRPGRGALFSVFLPVADMAPTSPEQPTAPPVASAGGETILIIDDDPAVRRVLRSILERDGYVVRESGDGPAALQTVAADRENIDLVILDISLPGMSGQQILAELTSTASDLGVIILTGLNVDPAEIPGAAAFLTKPVLPEQLLATISRTLGRSTPAA